MKYKVYDNSNQRLKDKIREQEERHYEITMDLKVAEALKDDERLLKLKKELESVEKVLVALNDL